MPARPPTLSLFYTPLTKAISDFLMGSDLDYSHPEVQNDVIQWGLWLADTIPLKGMRFDAIKHFSAAFLQKFVSKMDEKHGKGWFFVGEFWKDSLDDMHKYLDGMDRQFSLFDAPLVHNFSTISQTESADIRKVFDGTLLQSRPVNAVVSQRKDRPIALSLGLRLTYSASSTDTCHES